MKEFLDVLNKNGEYTNEIVSRDECHLKGLWHKAVVVFIISDDDKKYCCNKEVQIKSYGLICGI